MKILWIVNTIFPYPAEQLGLNENVFGGWLNGLSNELIKNTNISLTIATVYKGKKVIKFDDKKIKYYLLPSKSNIKYDKTLENCWLKVYNEVQPDLVHIHGTEYSHGLAFIIACPNIRVITSIQGLVSKIEKVYLGNLSQLDVIENITFRDIIKRDTLFDQKKKFYIKGKYEEEIIRKSNSVIGRTTWDYSNVKSINNDIKYYNCNEILREKFYEKQWNINNIERNSILLSQAGYPIKGLHILLEALKQLKSEIKNIKLYISGPNIIKYETFKDKIKLSGYGKYIKKIIREYDLKDNITFLGILNEEEMLNRMLKTHVLVSSSIIENESNSLSEASIIGLPSVCSYVGGIIDRIENGVNGFIYPFTESSILAEYIKRIILNDDLAKKISDNARKKYADINNKKTNVKTMSNIYEEILNSRR